MNGYRQYRAWVWRGILVPLVLLLSTTASYADFWYEHYARGEKALAAENWAVAVAEFEEALQKKGQSGSNVRTYGMNFIEYFPYYKLGVAQYHLGNHDAALQAFLAEEQQQQIQKAQVDYSELKRVRQLAQQVKDAAVDDELERIVAAGIDAAKRLEAQGDFAGAIDALSKVPADNTEAQAILVRLRDKIQQQQQKRAVDERVATLIREGRDLLASGQYGEASTRFQGALGLKSESAEARTLLSEAQDKLKAELARQDRESTIRDGLARAGRLESEGRIEEGLNELQAVLALDPRNTQGLALRQRLLDAQLAADQQTAVQDRIANLLSQARAHLDADEVEPAIATANRVLALEPLNAAAVDLIARAYREFRSLVTQEMTQNPPPFIAISNVPEQLNPEQAIDGHDLVQRVNRPGLVLTGTLLDNTPVTLKVLSSAGQILAEQDGTLDFLPLGGAYLANFNLDLRVAPGLSVFHVVAVDEQGAESVREYAVFYTVPFYRATWFIALVAAIPVLAGVLLFERRRRRINALRKRRYNPYIAGAPILDRKLFFGRQRLLNKVLQTVHNNSLLLYGERRIGKTSLQHHLKRRLKELDDPEFRFYPVYIDLQGTPQEKFFSTLAHDIFEELGPELDGLEPHANLESGAEYGYRELVRDIRAVLKVLKSKNEKRVKLVLQIDEVDELNAYDPRINQRLRSLFMKSFAENLVSVVSGVGIKKHWESEGSPWYNFFEEIPVNPFRDEDARELIERPIQGAFKLEKGVVDKIIAMTDCKPYLIQKLCISLVNHLYDEKRSTITIADVENLGRPKEA